MAVLRIRWWVFFLLGAICLAGAVGLYVSAVDVVPGEDPAAERAAAGELLDLTDYTGESLGAAGDISLMAQVDDRLIRSLGPVDADGGTLHLYVLFSVHDAPGATLARAAMVVRDRVATEEWMKEHMIGTAQMGGLYNIYGYSFYDRTIKSAVISALSEEGLTSTEDFLLMRPGLEAAIPPILVNPTRDELIGPLLLVLGAGLCLIFGMHTRAIQRRGKDIPDPLEDPILRVDDDGEGVLRRRF